MQVVLLLHETLVAAVPPNLKLVSPMVLKLVPVIVRTVPPPIDPEIIERLFRVGRARYVKPPVRVDEILLTVTTTSTAPAVPAGVVAVQVVTLLQVTLVAPAPPKVKLVPPVVLKFVPVIVRTVPPR